MLGRASGLGGEQLYVECDIKPPGDVILQCRVIVRITVERLGPQLRIGLGIDQPSIDPNVVARPVDAPFHNVAHTELAADLLRTRRLVAICGRRIARDHETVWDS